MRARRQRRTALESPRRTLTSSATRQSLGENVIAGRTFFDGQNGAHPIGINDEDVEPLAVAQQAEIELGVALDGGEAEQKYARR